MFHNSLKECSKSVLLILLMLLGDSLSRPSDVSGEARKFLRRSTILILNLHWEEAFSASVTISIS